MCQGPARTVLWGTAATGGRCSAQEPCWAHDGGPGVTGSPSGSSCDPAALGPAASGLERSSVVSQEILSVPPAVL